MEFILTTYRVIESKKNGKKYISYSLLCDKRYVCECLAEYSEILEEFIKNNLMENISEYVVLSYFANIKGFRPYIKYN